MCSLECGHSYLISYTDIIGREYGVRNGRKRVKLQIVSTPVDFYCIATQVAVILTAISKLIN